MVLEAGGDVDVGGDAESAGVKLCKKAEFVSSVNELICSCVGGSTLANVEAK